MIIGLSAAPMMQVQKFEKRVEFQSSLDIAHLIALQKARNGTYLKGLLSLTPGSDVEKCFGGRAGATACTTYHKVRTPTSTPVDLVTFNQGNYSAESAIFLEVNCTADKCTNIHISVESSQTSAVVAADGWSGRPLLADFSIPASALATRQEIDFTDCAGKIITGVDFDTLKSECIPMTGTNSCNGVASGGPMNTFGQPADLPANCQPPVNQTCPEGMAVFGMINGQAQCAPSMACTDPLSTNCSPPTTLPPVCIPNWQPTPATVCAGQTYTETNMSPLGCSAPFTRTAVGSNPGLCPVTNCALTGVIRWPNPLTGPCEVSAAAMNAAIGGNANVNNDKLGYIGSYTATCMDRTPLPPSFDTTSPVTTCQPIVCSGIPSTAEWSATGLKSAIAGPNLDPAGPWDCQGPIAITQASALPLGMLTTIQADATAQAVANNTSPLAAAGNLIITCSDPGPVTVPRSGMMNVSSVTCTLPTPTTLTTTTTTTSTTSIVVTTSSTIVTTTTGVPTTTSTTTPPAVNGVCGPAAGVVTATPPASGLCSAGTDSGILGAGPFAWTCFGSGGGSDATCTTPPPPPVRNCTGITFAPGFQCTGPLIAQRSLGYTPPRGPPSAAFCESNGATCCYYYLDPRTLRYHAYAHGPGSVLTPGSYTTEFGAMCY